MCPPRLLRVRQPPLRTRTQLQLHHRNNLLRSSLLLRLRFRLLPLILLVFPLPALRWWWRRLRLLVLSLLQLFRLLNRLLVLLGVVRRLILLLSLLQLSAVLSIHFV